MLPDEPAALLCESGRMDLGRAELFLEAASHLADEAEVAALAEMMDAYLAKYDDPTHPIVQIDRKKLATALRYRRMKLKQAGVEQEFHRAFRERRVWFRPHDQVPGIGRLGVTGRLTDLQLVDRHLTLLAQQGRRVDGETRTIDQLRADIVVDLLLGRHVPAGGGDEEADREGAGQGAGQGAWARPVINVTVPLSTTTSRFSPATTRSPPRSPARSP